ncbi:MAG: hypothetical protein V4469_04145 [Patescibacteria group bacterium]
MSKKVKKDLWEELFGYPSFNTRFWATIILGLFIFVIIGWLLLFETGIIVTVNDQLSVLNLLVQGATLFLAVFAAYFGLRQLVETRFISLDEAGLSEMRSNHYLKAFHKWKEAFYIRPDPTVFSNLCEALLFIGDFETFDDYIQMSQNQPKLKKNIFQETSDQILLFYLKSIRHLLVKNQGEAEKNISELVKLVVSENGLLGFQWEFADLRGSMLYIELTGECKEIAENLVSYLSKSMTPNRKIQFEKGDFSTKAD